MANKPGTQKRAPIGADSALQRSWNSMRRLRTFTSSEVVATAEAGEDTVKKYVRTLIGAGYITVVTPKREGVTGGHAVYRLVKNTGPVAPRMSLLGIFDANEADPYMQPPSKRLRRHAAAFHKALRELLDVLDRPEATFHQQNIARTAARDTLKRYDEDLR